jgi:hypothetical protein
MGFSIGDITDAVGDIAGGALDVVEAAGDLAGQAASVVGLANPAMAVGLASFAGGADMLGRIADAFIEQQENTRPGGCRKDRGERGERGGCDEKPGCDGKDGGGSIFEQIALAMGEAMDNKLQQLLEAADKVADLSGKLADDLDSGSASEGDKARAQGEIMTATAQVTARGQELNAISQASNSAINSLGNAASTAASKR